MKINETSYCGVIFRVANSRSAGHEILAACSTTSSSLPYLQQNTSGHLNKQYLLTYLLTYSMEQSPS